MNKYLLKGASLLASGIICIYISYDLMAAENNWYKLVMSFGVILFGYGFITLIYRLFRKIDRKSIMNDRKDPKN